MSFFDHLRRGAMALGRRPKEKVQAFSETTRLKSLLAGEEKYFHKLCDEIGEQFVRLHSEDYPPDFAELMTLAKESKNRADGYRSQINSVRKVRLCPNCGAEVPQEFAFCNYCGTRLPQVDTPVPSGFVRCTGCHALIPETMDFCNFCGQEQECHMAKEDDPLDRSEGEGSDADLAEHQELPQEESAQAPALEKPAEASAQEDTDGCPRP